MFFGLESLSGNCLVSRSGIVTERNPKQRQIDSDELQGVIQNPFAFYFPIQRGFSGPIQTLASDKTHCKPFDLLEPEQRISNSRSPFSGGMSIAMECSFRIGLNRTSLTTWPGKLNTMGWRLQLSQGHSTNEVSQASEEGNGRVIPSPEPSAMTSTLTDSNSQHLIGGGQSLGIEVASMKVELFLSPIFQIRLGHE